MQNVFEVDDNDVIYKDVVIIGEYTRCLEFDQKDWLNSSIMKGIQKSRGSKKYILL